jgi:glycosyltransferase involved in cell wall biosynthesis
MMTLMGRLGDGFSPVITSVLIPAYNCSRTIRATLDSVLNQSMTPDEVIVLDDGSTDETFSIVESYKPQVSVIRQANKGVASTRNALCQRASGDLLAFIDADDIWHTNYLEVQCKLFERHPNAIAFFTGRVNFFGDGTYEWANNPLEVSADEEIIPPLGFLEGYNAAPGRFSSMSHCCIPKTVLKTFEEPFKLKTAEDAYFFNLVGPLGPVVYVAAPLAAYRIHKGSLSSDRLKLTENEVRGFELLEERYRKLSDAKFTRVFKNAFASKRRSYAKVLLGAGRKTEARRQLLSSVVNSANSLSVGKSLALLFTTYLPSGLQPSWPASERQ